MSTELPPRRKVTFETKRGVSLTAAPVGGDRIELRFPTHPLPLGYALRKSYLIAFFEIRTNLMSRVNQQVMDLVWVDFHLHAPLILPSSFDHYVQLSSAQAISDRERNIQN